MRVAYLVHFRGGNESGIFRKVASQVAAWSRHGAEVGLFVATSPAAAGAWGSLPQAVSVRTPPAGPLGLLREREALVAEAGRWSPDVVYVRHGLVYPGLVRLAGRIPTVIEVNADDLSEFHLTSRRRHAFARVTRGLLLARAAGLVFVTNELATLPSFTRYQRPGIVIGNGIDLDSVPPLPVVTNASPRLIFVGHPRSPWHGLDHVAQLAAAFPQWDVDVVGPGPDELAADHPPNLVAHGMLEPADYRQLLEQADVAIGTLGLYRNRMQEASPLKVREYLAAGLPVIVGYRDTDFPGGAPFLLELPNTPSGVAQSTDAISSFVGRWMGRRVSRDAVMHLDADAKEGARLTFLERVADA